MARWRRQSGPFIAVGAGRYVLNLDADDRQVLRNLLTEMGDTLGATGNPALRRLYPTAYPNNPDLDAEYQELMRDDLEASHRSAVQRVIDTLGDPEPGQPELDEPELDQPELDQDDLEAWMRTLNAARLVLGTRLEVSEDTDPADGLFVHPDPGNPGPPRLADSPDAPARFAYLWLSELLESAVDAASRHL